LLVAGGLALLFAAPWLPPRRAMREAAARIMLHPGNRLVTARAGESILDAGLRGGVSLPFECRNGGCGVCKATLLAGSVDYGAYQPSALSDAERREGKLLLCCATPLADDVEVEYEESSARARSVRSYGAVVEGLECLAPDVMHVRLRLADGERMRFEAGQFVNIVLADGARRSYSFTTAPCETETIDLHIRLIPGGRFTSHVFDGMTVGETLLLEGPFGNVSIRDGTQPLILVAGATGFAPVKSVLEHAFAAGFRRPLVLYWGVRRRCDLYLSALPEQWQRDHSNFRYIPVLSAPAPEDAWTGRTGLVHEAILADYPDLSGFEMYVCGSVKMLDAARPAFLAHGLHEDACFTDIFVSSERHTTSAKESSPPSS
ncbi:MAG TPA: 2Fe-2S iron-sulfur cluster-binding protein, partial [Burkholderiales bacterium]|nr:2Fe-2S iron-sulfur cluster-binding protein [Burkholderiales bacterium]